MIRFDTTLGELRPTNFGRIASFYYISYKTMEMFYEKFDRNTPESALIQLISEASEFAQIQVNNTFSIFFNVLTYSFLLG